VPDGTAHDWWDAGDEEAHVVVEIRPGERFEEMALNLFGLAQDGKANAKGMPNLVQAAVFAREFSDVPYFTRPPLWAQRLLFGALAASARVLGYRGSYPKYAEAPAPESSSGVGEGPVDDEGAGGDARSGGPSVAGVLVVARGTRHTPIPTRCLISVRYGCIRVRRAASQDRRRRVL
jgi:hypothetical protein